MSYADQLFIENCRSILNDGTWDTEYNLSLIHILQKVRGMR